MNAVSRRGACPALSAPMQTGDGLLARLSPVASGLSPKALIGLCESARRHGNGVVEITARGSFQIRGLTATSAVQLAAEVDALNIAVRTGVPVETGRLAGLDPGEIADPTPLAEAIRAGIAAAGLEGRLGPKVSVVVDGGGNSGMSEIMADVRLAAERTSAARQDAPLWRLAIAGYAATATTFGTISEADASASVVAVLHAVAALGLDSRARDLLAGDREAKLDLLKGLRSTLPPSGLPATSPPSGPNSSCDIADWLISPLVGGLAGRPEGDDARRNRQPSILPLADGRLALAVTLPFGHVEAGRLIDLAHEAETQGVADVRLAPLRTVLLLCSSEDAATDLRAAARQLGFVTDPADPRASISACPGSPACASGRIPARTLADEAAPALASLLDGSASVHISGCAKGCAHPGASTLTLVGVGNGAGLVVGGTARQAPAASMPGGEACAALVRLAELVASTRRGGESSATCLSRLGTDRLAAAFERKTA